MFLYEKFLKTPIRAIAIIGSGLSARLLAYQLDKMRIPCKLFEDLSSQDISALPASTGCLLSKQDLDILQQLGMPAIQEKSKITTVMSDQGIFPLSEGFVTSHLGDLFQRPSSNEGSCSGFLKNIPVSYEACGHNFKFERNRIQVSPFKGIEHKKSANEQFDAVIFADGHSHYNSSKHLFESDRIDANNVLKFTWIANAKNHGISTFDKEHGRILITHPFGENKTLCQGITPHLFPEDSFKYCEVRKNFRCFGAKFVEEIEHVRAVQLYTAKSRKFALENTPVAFIGKAAQPLSSTDGFSHVLRDIASLTFLLQKFSLPEALSHYQRFRAQDMEDIIGFPGPRFYTNAQHYVKKLEALNKQPVYEKLESYLKEVEYASENKSRNRSFSF
jgi:2-polyprenyl-6-methoxyphenol hydroxylase-like FAD-dependent oxidoreductase